MWDQILLFLSAVTIPHLQLLWCTCLKYFIAWKPIFKYLACEPLHIWTCVNISSRLSVIIKLGIYSSNHIFCCWSKHVLTEDVLERHVMTDGKLYSLKLLTKTNPLPRWAIPLYNGPKFVTIVEESIVDPITQTFTTYTRNISLSHFMVSISFYMKTFNLCIPCLVYDQCYM